jgi:Bax protein
MQIKVKNSIKNNIWDTALTVIIIAIGLYVIFLPLTPEINISVKPEEKEDKKVAQKLEKKELTVIYKKIKSVDEIVPINCSSVIPVVYENTVSLKDLPVDKRKKKFIDFILPSILIANYKIEKLRKKLLDIKNKIEYSQNLTKKEKELLKNLLDEYKASSLEELLRKINTHKPSLIISQAAIESGWGTSRFFVQANNIFGIWTFDKKRASKIKAKKSNVYLKEYSNILESIEDYYYSINVSWAYKSFRYVRLQTKDSLKLVKHLENYSTLREYYVKRIEKIIKYNNLTYYDNCRLDKSYLGR